MQRILEPELMDDPVQAAAYASADFSDPHGLFINKFREVFPGSSITGHVLDLGCGPADISVRFAEAYPACHIYGVDGARAMLTEGQAAIKRRGLEQRIKLIYGVIPDLELPQIIYQIIMSNSLLHHLHDPLVLWKYIKKISSCDTQIFIMDLIRPYTCHDADKLVNTYCGTEAEILRRDFYNSLCAAFCPTEVEQQLGETGLQGLKIDVITDRHMIIYGQITNAQI